jgi:general L-amino acid transport system permease protein
MTTEFSRPPDPPGPIKWARNNLFSSWLNTLLTIISAVVVYLVVTGMFRWIFFQADWRPVVSSPLLYLVGQYPREQLWRIGLSALLHLLLLGVCWGRWSGLLKTISLGLCGLLLFFALLPVQHPELTLSMRLFLGASVLIIIAGYYLARLKQVRTVHIIAGWVIAPTIAMFLLSGFQNSALIPAVATTSWGGLVVTLILSAGGIVLSFPIGVALALGRRSKLPVVSVFSTLSIEIVRGMPLITILFMFSVILVLFLPPEARIDRLVRALMAMTFFSAVYMAENVRGGLQAVPAGQAEAAKALGMNGFQITFLIVLPQALRAVLPAIVGQFISLFKDTTLVIIVGINDLLGIGKSILNQDTEYVRLQLEVYLFVTLIFWVLSYLMSVGSRRLETALGVGDR